MADAHSPGPCRVLRGGGGAGGRAAGRTRRWSHATLPRSSEGPRPLSGSLPGCGLRVFSRKAQNSAKRFPSPHSPPCSCAHPPAASLYSVCFCFSVPSRALFAQFLAQQAFQLPHIHSVLGVLLGQFHGKSLPLGRASAAHGSTWVFVVSLPPGRLIFSFLPFFTSPSYPAFKTDPAQLRPELRGLPRAWPPCLLLPLPAEVVALPSECGRGRSTSAPCRRGL